MIVINESLARKRRPNEDPIGKHIRGTMEKNGADPSWLTIIGVVKDVKQVSLEDSARPEIVRPMVDYANLTLSVRTSRDPQTMTAAIDRQIWMLDKDLPVYDILTMQEIVEDNMGQRRFDSVLLIIFGSLALILAGVGVYGVLMSVTSQRTREIAIRIALGAQRGDILTMVLTQGLRLAAVGLFIGVFLGAVASKLLASMFFFVTAANLSAYVSVCILMGTVVLLACYLPARKATSVDPLGALKCE